MKSSGAAAIATGGAGEVSARSRIAQTKKRSTKRKVNAPGAPRAAGPYSHAIIAGNTIYVSGQGPFDPATGQMPSGFEDQAARTLENIKTILAAAGATMDDVVKVNVYLADLSNFQKMNDVYRRFFKEPYPARATIGSQLLLEMGIEIECVAVKS
jgi:2-iminobutanoate/2-iminopropanoate deaminase